ncbi:MAG: HD domain-containing protein, partial [Planctomycetota bacterium]
TSIPPTPSPTPAPKPAPGFQNALPTRRFIADLQPSERVEGTFSYSNAQLGRTRSDKPYLRCLVGDKTGEMTARMWSVDESILSRMPADGFAFIQGETQKYQGEMQFIIQTMEPADPSAEEMRDLLPSSARPAAEMFAELTGVLETLVHPAMKALAKVYLNDAFLMEQLRACPAAKSAHHACLGGLLEHTLSLVNLANAICPLYPKINRDLVIMGLFLHDLGKTRELAFDRAFSYTDRGELIGHIVDGAIMLHDKAQQVMRETGQRLPANATMVLQHIILSHHGLPEHGAARVPMTPEAILVHLLDNIDAKMAMALTATRGPRARLDLGGSFTDRLWALDTKLFKPDPLA